MKKILVVALVVAIALIGVTAAFAATGDHRDMSCRVCHRPHGGDANPPLWDAAANTARGGGSGSAICVACHDNSETVAGQGQLANPTRTGVAEGGKVNHPYGQVATAGAKGIPAGLTIVSGGSVTYIGGNRIECQSCHFVHLSTAQTGSQYVRTSGTGTTFCQTCHSGNW